jgi:hypothetical protein
MQTREHFVQALLLPSVRPSFSSKHSNTIQIPHQRAGQWQGRSTQESIFLQPESEVFPNPMVHTTQSSHTRSEHKSGGNGMSRDILSDCKGPQKKKKKKAKETCKRHKMNVLLLSSTQGPFFFIRQGYNCAALELHTHSQLGSRG